MKNWTEIDGNDTRAVRQQHLDIAAETTGITSEYHAAMAASYIGGDAEFNYAMKIRDALSLEAGCSPIGIMVWPEINS